LGDELSDVHYRAEPGIILTHEVCILNADKSSAYKNEHLKDRMDLNPPKAYRDQPKHGCVGERGLVELLEEVDSKHNREEGEIDSPKDSFVVCLRNDDMFGGIAQKLGSAVLACSIAYLERLFGRVFDRFDGSFVVSRLAFLCRAHIKRTMSKTGTRRVK
jgi:hypothetical protein